MDAEKNGAPMRASAKLGALDGVPLHCDQHHLSILGARQLTPLLQAF